MPTAENPARLTITITDPALIEAIRDIAAERHLPIRKIVVDALRKWLADIEAREMEADRIAAREAREDAEPTMDFDEYVSQRQNRV